MMTQKNDSALVNKTNFIRLVAIIFLAWACYIPDVKLDLKNQYVVTGVLERHASKNSTSLSIKGKTLCTSVFFMGCQSGLSFSPQLESKMNNKKSVEVVFANDIGNSIDAIIFKRAFAIEVRVNGVALPFCTKEYLLKTAYKPSWFAKFFSVLTFFIVLPLIFNCSFYHNLWNNFWEK